jgi:uncharacterized protein DUF6272
MKKNLYDIHDGFSDQNLFLTFSGPMSQDLTVEKGEILKTKMEQEGASLSTTQKVFSILVELIQNIIHYSAEKDTTQQASGKEVTTGCGIIAIGKTPKHYFLIGGNLVKQQETERLQHILTSLNEMSSAELKELYQAQRRKGPEESSKGAGLGFIEMARKTSQPLSFDFTPIDEQHVFFSLKAII